jgi:hypothetical protein
MHKPWPQEGLLHRPSLTLSLPCPILLELTHGGYNVCSWDKKIWKDKRSPGSEDGSGVKVDHIQRMLGSGSVVFRNLSHRRWTFLITGSLLLRQCMESYRKAMNSMGSKMPSWKHCVYSGFIVEVTKKVNKIPPFLGSIKPNWMIYQVLWS